jgi:uncharacterized protein (DUF433 family)
MSQVVTLRLPDEAADAVKQIARKERRSVNEIGARIIEEWLRQNRFIFIEFRTVGGERLACIKERLPVWEVVFVAQDYDMDPARTAEHLRLRPEQVEAALHYYAAYSEEIDAALQENEQGFDRLREMLPGLQRVTITTPDVR